MPSSTSSNIENLKIHKVPNFSLWKSQYNQTNGIGTDDLVIIPPAQLETDIKGWVPSASDTDPIIDGTADAGSATTWARADHVHPTDTSRAPTSHASSDTTYGTGTSSNYGHLKLSASTSSTSGTSGGIAATPSAVKEAYDLASTAKVTADGIISASGTTTGTSTAYILSAANFTLADGKTIKFKLHIDSGSAPTINVGGTGAKALKTANGDDMPTALAGAWITAIYSSTLDFFVLASNSSSKSSRYSPLLMEAFLGYSPLYEILA